MGRYIRDVQLNQPEDFVFFMMNDFLTKHGFAQQEFKGEMVYRSGGGMIEMPKFIKFFYQNGFFHLEAWTRMLWMPGVYGNENALNGFFGCLPKKLFKDDLEELIRLLFQPIPGAGQPQNAAYPQEQGRPTVEEQPQSTGMPQANDPVFVHGTDTSRYGTLALTTGIIALCTGWLIPVLGIIMGFTGIIYGQKGISAVRSGKATAGFVTGILGLIVSVLSGVVWIFLIY